MTKQETNHHNEQRLAQYQREQGKEGEALPLLPGEPGTYYCIVRHEPFGSHFWTSELPCIWDGEKWERCDGGPLRHGIVSWSKEPTVKND